MMAVSMRAGAPEELPARPGGAAAAPGEAAAAAGKPSAAVDESAAAPEEASTVEWPWGELETVDAAPFYLDVARAGIQYGPAFQMVRKLSGDGTAVVLR